MASKENKGGILRNDQVEKELERTGAAVKASRGYGGMQDTGDEILRDMGTDVQRNDGNPPEEIEKADGDR